MTARNLRWLPVAATLLLAACGGGTTATTGPGSGTAGPGPTAGSGQGTSAPVTAGPVATQAGGGGTYTGKVCDLLTVAEVEDVTGVAGTTGTETPMVNGSGACLYKNADNGIGGAIAVVDGAPAQDVFNTWKSQTDTVELSGIGDGALWMPTAQTIYIIKNGVLVSIQAGGFSVSADERKEWGTEFAKLIAGRL